MTQDDLDQLVADVEAFCQEIRPVEDLCYLEHRYNDQTIPLAKKHNVLGMHVPTEYGGRGADLHTYMHAIVRIGREGTGVRTLFSGHCSIGQMPILRFGTPQQKQRFLPPSCCGDKIMAFALTEPDAGSNPLEMQTTYRREGDQIILNGVKYLISNGGIAGTMVVFGYPEEQVGSRISAFIIDADGPGIEREQLVAKLGMPTSDTAMFELTEFAVPAENLLGDEGEGWRVALDTLLTGRLSVAAGCLGVIEDCLAEAIEYACQRHQHGKEIAKHQLIQDHIAQIELAREATASLLDTAIEARMASEDDPANRETYRRSDMLAAKVKLFASNVACESADRAVQILGGRGYSELWRPGRHWKDVRVCRIYEGTDEILKLKIASGVLGKQYEAFR